MEPNEIILARWVDQAIDQSLKKKNIKARFKATSICLFNPKAMDKKIQTLKIYIVVSINNHENDQEEYKLDEETYYNQG